MLVGRMIAAASDLINQIHAHPFNREIALGTLPPDRFAYYLRQDRLYIADSKEAHSLIARRLNEAGKPAIAAQFLTFSHGMLSVDDMIHALYPQVLNQCLMFPPPQPEKNQACHQYTKHLFDLINNPDVPIAVAVAAVFPCFLIYKLLGQHAVKAGHRPNNRHYKAWIDSYSSRGFIRSADSLGDITEELAAAADPNTHRLMVEAFSTSVYHEWNFFQYAYHKGQVPDQQVSQEVDTQFKLAGRR